MRAILIASLTLIAAFTLSYGIASFISFNLNPSSWTENYRAGTVGMCFILWFLIFRMVITYLSDD